MKNEFKRMITALALAINVIGFALMMYFKSFEGFEVGFFVLWGFALLWLTLFIYINYFYKSKNNKRVRDIQN